MRNIIIKLFMIAILINIYPNYAFCQEMISDKYGQSAPKALDEAVTKAKELRMRGKPGFNPKKSIEILENVVKLKKDYYRAYYNLGFAYNEINEHEKSKQAFERALLIKNQHNIKDDSIYFSASWASYYAGDYSSAVNIINSGLKHENTNSPKINGELHNLLGLILINNLNAKSAEEHFAMAYKKYNLIPAQENLDIARKLKQNWQQSRQLIKPKPSPAK